MSSPFVASPPVALHRRLASKLSSCPAAAPERQLQENVAGPAPSLDGDGRDTGSGCDGARRTLGGTLRRSCLPHRASAVTQLSTDIPCYWCAGSGIRRQT